MDFILLPDNVISHEAVPDLGGLEWDNQGFQGYPQRQGWDLERLRNGDIPAARNDWGDYVVSLWKHIPPLEMPQDERLYGLALIRAAIGAFIQTWILFGLLQAALRRPIHRHEVSRIILSTNAGGEDISSRSITVRHLFAEFLREGEDLKRDPAWTEHLLGCLSKAIGILWDLGSLRDELGAYFLPVRVHLALSVLVGTLHHHLYNLCGTELKLQHFGYGECKSVQEMLIHDRRWCPNMVQRIVTLLGVEGLYYTSLLPTFAAEQVHDRCDAGVCVASNISSGTYEIMHAPRHCICINGCTHRQPMCLCTHIGILETELATALAAGGVPLIKYDGNSVKIVRYQSGMAYIAISHVWADGKGNPHQNSLPRCQIQAISGQVARVSMNKDSLFWLDTLCVPVKGPLRNTAILRMAEIYSSASHVLVLLADLLSINFPSTPDEALVRIIRSQWATRLWAMQEAALAKQLVFGFADEDVCQSTLSQVITDPSFNSGEQSRQIGALADGALGRICAIKKLTQHYHLSLSWFCNSLPFRSTSRPSDVAICGSILLGHGLETVLSAPDNEKMQAFWSCQKKVPASLIWAATDSRLRLDGLRWAPRDLLHARIPLLSIDNELPTAEPTTSGLLVTGLEAVLLESVPLPEAETDVFRFLLPLTQQYYFCIKSANAEQETWSEIQEAWINQVVLLLSRQQFEGSSAGFNAALVLPTQALNDNPNWEDVAKPIRVRYLAQIMLLAEDNSLTTSWRDHVYEAGAALRKLIKRQAMKVVDVADSRHIGVSQQWCIF